MYWISNRKFFFLTLISGLFFIAIGTISIIDSFFTKDISVNSTITDNKVHLFSPRMNTNSEINLTVAGSLFNLTLYGPSGDVIVSRSNISQYNLEFVAENEGEHKVEVSNLGDEPLYVKGIMQSKSNSLAFGGSMMLIITGVILAGISIRFKQIV